MEKYVDWNLYDQIQFSLLERKPTSPQIAAFYFLIH